ncbi:tryptophan 2,3-dioxygenase family protein [Streptomyces sp. NPDC005925]|uniref:tryptophan 2,3-dioxygenase family protein n=1 Tax=Streptomyces sp. NPDC005925 TaxID=3157172 RepID=UPI0033C2BAB5
MKSTAADRPAGDAHARADHPLTYESYLRVPELLRLQQPLSTAPDELHFIIVHQAMELWFRLLVDDLRGLVPLLDEGRVTECCARLRRVNDTMVVLLAQLRTLRDLPPAGFHSFRALLDGASGLQSVQFRELEVLSGLRDEPYLRAVRAAHGGTLPPSVTDALRRRSVAEAHRDAGRREGLTDWAELYLPPHTGSALYLLSELLLDYDELWLRWRTEHVALVRRMIGGDTPGTGGTSISYLEHTLAHRFFPYLWEARDHLPGAMESAHPAGHPSRTPAGGCPAFYEGGHNT